jgi:hypothetical protein
MSMVETPFPHRPDLGIKVLLPRASPEFWTTIEREWAGANHQRWKSLCMLHLYVHCGWSLRMLGLAFGHPKGHVSRILKAVKRELAERFEPVMPEAEMRAEQIESEPEDEAP